uniref:Uncharacterized protein n=1 Tax=Utricularia reniformis TaxID=192314 RepID=A0A1Y0B3A1_9LAMI|nr:hypothetical protein AEK19_MT1685 [Utricularia reniformis]ART31867.1 hypothetical protein AEK19_MT1685 [Utricularia reniformis]
MTLVVISFVLKEAKGRCEDRNEFEFGMLRTADKSDCPLISREKAILHIRLETCPFSRYQDERFTGQADCYC